jgi:HK97 gp10 family phage protein
MPEIFTVTVEGFAELERKLRRIPDDLAKTALKDATQQGGEVFRTEMRARIHNVSGKLFRSIQNRVRQSGPGQMQAVVGPASKERYIANFLEFGTKPHVVEVKDKKALATGGTILGREIQHPGAAPHPFLRPAFDTGKEDALALFTVRLQEFFEAQGK